MNEKHVLPIALCITLCVLPGIAQAYIGPGAGITFIGSLVAILLAVLSAIGFILFWPVRRMLAKRKAGGGAAVEESSAVAQNEKAERKDASEDS